MCYFNVYFVGWFFVFILSCFWEKCVKYCDVIIGGKENVLLFFLLCFFCIVNIEYSVKIVNIGYWKRVWVCLWNCLLYVLYKE